MSQKLRPYQIGAKQAVLDAIDPYFGDSYTRVLYTLATGCGKTTTFADLVKDFLAEDKKVLVLAHRKELITQAYERIKDHCDLSPWEIGIELAATRAHGGHRVIVGSVQTCVKTGRPVETWIPDVIIADECHHCPSSSYRKIATRYGVDNGECIYIGCTATAKRTDRLSLYARKLNGDPVMLERKGRPPRPATAAESVFEKLVYEYGMLEAVEDGWLVPVLGHVVETDTDINEVETDRDGDFKEGQLAKAVDNARRTVQAISAWKEIASDRQTLVFCASVEHAHHAAELWTQAGYTAAAIDGETDSWTRTQHFKDFASGKLQVLTNMGVATEGTDLPNCSCIVHLRPTKSWNLYVQMSGRGTRAWPGVLNGLENSEAVERLRAIEGSQKPNCYVIDLVDLYDKCGDLCSVPSILDLPVKLDLQGNSLTEAKKLLDEFEEVKERVIGECPTTFEELKVKLQQVNLMRHSGAKTTAAWKATDEGYRYTKVPPGYTCEMTPAENNEGYRLMVKFKGEPILTRGGKAGFDMKEYMDRASAIAVDAIDEHKAKQPKPNRGTSSRLTEKQVRVLTRNGHSISEIDTMPYAFAKAKIDAYMTAWKQRMGIV